MEWEEHRDVGPDGVGPDDVGPDDVGPDDVGPDDVGLRLERARSPAKAIGDCQGSNIEF